MCVMPLARLHLPCAAPHLNPLAHHLVPHLLSSHPVTPAPPPPASVTLSASTLHPSDGVELAPEAGLPPLQEALTQEQHEQLLTEEEKRREQVGRWTSGRQLIRIV